MGSIEDIVRKAFETGKEFYRGQKITSTNDSPCARYSMAWAHGHEVDITFNFRKQRYGQKIIDSAKRCSRDIGADGYVITLKERKSNHIVMGLADIEKVKKILTEKYPNERF